MGHNFQKDAEMHARLADARAEYAKFLSLMHPQYLENIQLASDHWVIEELFLSFMHGYEAGKAKCST